MSIEFILGTVDAVGVAAFIFCLLLYHHITKLYDEVLGIRKTQWKITQIITKEVKK